MCQASSYETGPQESETVDAPMEEEDGDNTEVDDGNEAEDDSKQSRCLKN